MTLRTQIEKCDGCKWNGKEYDLNHGDVVHVNEDGSCAKCGRSRQQAHPLEEGWRENLKSTWKKLGLHLGYKNNHLDVIEELFSQTLAQERAKAVEEALHKLTEDGFITSEDWEKAKLALTDLQVKE